MALVENIQRQDLDPIEIGLSYQRLIDEIELTQEQLSQRVGKNVRPSPTICAIEARPHCANRYARRIFIHGTRPCTH